MSFGLNHVLSFDELACRGPLSGHSITEDVSEGAPVSGIVCLWTPSGCVCGWFLRGCDQVRGPDFPQQRFLEKLIEAESLQILVEVVKPFPNFSFALDVVAFVLSQSM